MPYDELLNQPLTVSISPKKIFAGTVLRTGADFLLLDDDQLGLLMLATEHIKQIKLSSSQAPAKSKRRTHTYGSHDLDVIPAVFRDVLLGLRQSVVQIESGRAEPTVGYLVDTREDYLTLCTIPDGLVHIPVRHLFAVLLLNVHVLPEFTAWAEQRQVEWMPGATFRDLLHNATGQRVTLGRGSPEELTGLIQSVDATTVRLITSPHEAIWVPEPHIKSLTQQVPLNWLPLTTL